ncbi:MAG TPA: penicillin acylase family protein, partial [Vicinamibacterales bacterium]|nr:penicillin acylase family protein [Vicinamibacterales bacterium]
MARCVVFLVLLAVLQPPARPQPATLGSLSRAALSQIDGTIPVPGLKGRVHVRRDSWGVPHIYAQSTGDLFFSQGYVTAQDRLWQMEMWRRGAEGRLAEVLGPAALPRDRQTRLLKFRGAIGDAELASYHPDARGIMTAYAAGVNAWIAEATRAGTLPVEFMLTGIRPGPWTLETLLLRQTTFGDAAAELQLARSVAELGPAAANRLRNPDPFEDLVVPAGLDVTAITDAVLAATRGPGATPRPLVLPEYGALAGTTPGEQPTGSIREPGSNNWVVSGALSVTGKPVVVNDPHREVTNPSLRYIVHLNGPGWNVIGASEPPFLGVAIGHNDRIAWGLTIVGTDQQDVYVEELNPANADEVKWNGTWEPLRVVREQIPVKGAGAESVAMKFSRHGPIFFVDRERHRAYALRSALGEPGTAPYLAGLRLAQVRDCRRFLDAAMYWKAPSENLICGDVDGNISWQASALTPARQGWSGRLPVPGTGAFEWKGFRTNLPRELNPARGFIVTANHNIQPKGYTPPLMFKAADTKFDRITRLLQMLRPGKQYTLQDHARMQHDAYSLRAAADLAIFKGWTARDANVERARGMLERWDAVYRRDSAEAALYETWRTAPASRDSTEERLRKALGRLVTEQGADWSGWRWGRMHMRAFPHPFVPAFNITSVERGGGAGTVAADGASYRQIVDVSNWD